MDFDGLKEGAKRVGKFMLQGLKTVGLKIVLPIVLIVVILAAAWFTQTTDDGKVKKGNTKNVPYMASFKYINSVNISEDGKITTEISAKELWDMLRKNGSNVNKYLSNAKELKQLMDAEIVTQYPDTRPSVEDDPSADSHVGDEIDEDKWKAIFKDTDSKDIQGIIQFKRFDQDGNETNLSFVDRDTFQSYIDDYNSTGSEEAKKKAMSHFTLKDANDTSDGTGITNGSTPASDSIFDKMLFIGDSWTVRLENSKVLNNSIFSGKVGETAVYFNKNFSSLPDNSDVSSVCVDLGVNNPDTVSDMEKLIDSLVSKYSGKKIYVQRVFPVTSQYSGAYDYRTLNSKVNSYNSKIKRFCEKYDNVYYIDATNGKTNFINSDGSGDSSKYESDGLHLKMSSNFDWVENIKYAIGQVDSSTVDKSSSADGSSDSADEETSVSSNDDKSTNSENDDSANSTDDSSEEKKWVAEIASWNEMTTKVESNDPNTASSSNTTYNMTTKDINYQEVVKGYTMPFDYLWPWLTFTEDKKFVLAVADLVYNSDIEIGIYDNYTETTNISTENYTIDTKTDFSANYEITGKTSTGDAFSRAYRTN